MSLIFHVSLMVYRLTKNYMVNYSWLKPNVVDVKGLTLTILLFEQSKLPLRTILSHIMLKLNKFSTKYYKFYVTWWCAPCYGSNQASTLVFEVGFPMHYLRQLETYIIFSLVGTFQCSIEYSEIIVR